MSLFDSGPDESRPLADRMRPERLEDYVGQEHILGPGKPLRVQIEKDRLTSIILWGPPGVGKTTLATLVARHTKSSFVPFSAVMSGIKEIKEVMAKAERMRRMNLRTVLFIDEIHRFNKAQQDAFLPYVERGDIVLIGATTENPSFEVISALLSRSKVYALRPLSEDEVVELLNRAAKVLKIAAPEDLLRQISIYSNGDARTAYNVLEIATAASSGDHLDPAAVESAIERKTLLYDKSGEEHYNLVSALHKSVRSSRPDAALYWLARMLEAGEDRMYIARRLAGMAIEDIGLADPRAVEQAVACMNTVHLLGVPEGDQALAQAAIYLSAAPKSDSAYQALNEARVLVRTRPPAQVPLHLRNAPTKAMKEWGYGAGYDHAHLNEEGLTTMECLPEGLEDQVFYQPTTRGFESRLKDRLDAIRAWIANRRQSS